VLHRQIVRPRYTPADRMILTPQPGDQPCPRSAGRPATHSPVDPFAHLPAETLGQAWIQPFRPEHGISEAVRINRRRLSRPALLIKRQTEPEIDAQLVEKLLNLNLSAASFAHQDSMPASWSGVSPNPANVRGQRTQRRSCARRCLL
jgi:hypothetical protein